MLSSSFTVVWLVCYECNDIWTHLWHDVPKHSSKHTVHISDCNSVPSAICLQTLVEHDEWCGNDVGPSGQKGLIMDHLIWITALLNSSAVARIEANKQCGLKTQQRLLTRRLWNKISHTRWICVSSISLALSGSNSESQMTLWGRPMWWYDKWFMLAFKEACDNNQVLCQHQSHTSTTAVPQSINTSTHLLFHTVLLSPAQQSLTEGTRY